MPRRHFIGLCAAGAAQSSLTNAMQAVQVARQAVDVSWLTSVPKVEQSAPLPFAERAPTAAIFQIADYPST